MNNTRRGRRVAYLGIGLLTTTALTIGGASLAGADTSDRSTVARGEPRTSESREERNERNAVAFMQLAINEQRPERAVDLYMGETFIQHNPQNVDGPDAFITWANGLIRFAPEVNVAIKRTLADANLVTVHSHFTTSPTDRGFAVVDMFRFEDGKIVEHWDVVQAVPETSANDNTMF